MLSVFMMMLSSVVLAGIFQLFPGLKPIWESFVLKLAEIFAKVF